MSSRASSEARRPWMPTDQQVLLVRAALLEREPAIEAWNQWKKAGGFARIGAGSVLLLPIVYRNLVDHGVSDPALKHARLAYQMTWLGNERFFRGVFALLNSLRAAGIETMIMKGAALSLLYYKDLGLRSMGDVDILIRPHEVANVIDILVELGGKEISDIPNVLTETYLYARHAIHYSSDRISNLDLHWHVMDEACPPSEDEPFWSGAIRTTIRGVETLVMSPTDQLLHVCAHEARWTPIPFPRWIVDVVTILRTSPDDINWDRLISLARRLRMVIPVREALQHVVDVGGAPIPSSVLTNLHHLSLSKEEVRDYRIRCLQPNPLRILSMEYRRMSLQPSRHSRRWRLFAFPSYARALWGLDHAWQLPFYGLLWGARTLTRSCRYYLGKLTRRTF